MNDLMDNWKKKELWKRDGRDFCVEVSRHEALEGLGLGPNRWAVYCYIYPQHPHFKEFNGPSIWQEATEVLPLHGGCTFLRYHIADDKHRSVTSIQVGADYNRLHDEGYTFCDDPGSAYQVFRDADELYGWLTEAGSK